MAAAAQGGRETRKRERGENQKYNILLGLSGVGHRTSDIAPPEKADFSLRSK